MLLLHINIYYFTILIVFLVCKINKKIFHLYILNIKNYIIHKHLIFFNYNIQICKYIDLSLSSDFMFLYKNHILRNFCKQHTLNRIICISIKKHIENIFYHIYIMIFINFILILFSQNLNTLNIKKALYRYIFYIVKM